MNENSDLALLLNEQDHKMVMSLAEQCQSSWAKRQIFRTETEMRLSVLNDGKHPTTASKYWQSVREQASIYEILVGFTFDFRRHKIKIKQKERKLESETDPLRRELIEIDLEELAWKTESMKQAAHHYARELEHWSRIINELDDGTFNTEDPDAHQYDWLQKRFDNSLKAMSENTSASEAINIIGLAQTVKRTQNENPKWLQERKERTNQLLENSKNKMINN